jgi:hypothetical protein
MPGITTSDRSVFVPAHPNKQAARITKTNNDTVKREDTVSREPIWINSMQ